jgi:NAD(P)-dependent dehydrogenase (short-subunit alcohol dehydrogenase family)
VLVTGASRGIGTAIAERFAADGARVAVSARTVDDGDHPLPGSLAATVRGIVARGGEAVAVAADLSLSADRKRLVDEVSDRLGAIDVLVNNAAVTWFEPVETFDERHYALMFEVQVKAPFDLSRRVLPAMREKKQGWILNISSGAARHPRPDARRGRGSAVYGMCKAALERFTTGLAAEVHEHGIAVNALSPSGLVATPGVVHHGLQRNVPEAFIEPVEVMAEAAWLLCTGDPATMTGLVTYSRSLLEERGASVPRA